MVDEIIYFDSSLKVTRGDGSSNGLKKAHGIQCFVDMACQSKNCAHMRVKFLHYPFSGCDMLHRPRLKTNISLFF